ncbi:hypothetical protein Cflav_PD3942 [Pedosphaera parvula Ellin514]|uniref:Uncharacterized protein n=1 Tax=Pedosphaera parvula (strain Ellin514) TaxID=320771 RepID=B9XG63_PEDPL|nr:hypothetical protein Cflav_PD3942 [Pedosphaera parvula Ellin514]
MRVSDAVNIVGGTAGNFVGRFPDFKTDGLG